jgi:hypothetical protein
MAMATMTVNIVMIINYEEICIQSSLNSQYYY